jgi:hypothetical protein
MNVEEIADLLPLLKKKVIKSVMGKLYFTSRDRYLSESECRLVLLSLREGQRQAIVRMFGSAASEMLETSMEDTEDSGSAGSNTCDEQISDELDSSFIDDDDDDDNDGSDDEDEDDEDYTVDIDA